MAHNRIALLAALIAAPVAAQDETVQALPSMEAALSDNARQLLAGVPHRQTLFAIEGSEPFDGEMLKADVISFAKNSELVLRNTTAPLIIIYAREMKFPDTVSNYRIRFEDALGPDGSDGKDGARGANGNGETNFKGRPGSSGGAGQSGAAGVSRTLPEVLMVVGEFSVGNDPRPRLVNLSLKLRGLSGGDGGRGGEGGDGGTGARGHAGSDGFGFCKHGGGDGGRGGDGGVGGGVGGTGGNGGRGGDGVKFTFLSTPLGANQFGYASIMNQGGAGGANGSPGRSGKPGNGGPGGHGSRFCGGGHGGDTGQTPATSAAGVDGAKGDKGTVTLKSVPIVPVFD